MFYSEKHNFCLVPVFVYLQTHPRVPSFFKFLRICNSFKVVYICNQYMLEKSNKIN